MPANSQETIFGFLNHLWFMSFRAILSEFRGVAMPARKPNDVVQLSKIRIRESLRKKLAKAAEINATTLNGEIVRRIEVHSRKRSGTSSSCAT